MIQAAELPLPTLFLFSRLHHRSHLLIAYRSGRMYDKTLVDFRRRLNTELISKTEMALQAIKRYDEKQGRLATDHRRDPKNLMEELEYDYSRLARHRKIELDRTYKVNLLNYGQEFYCLEMANYIFPMRVFIKNVRREGTMFIGYDQEFPGMMSKRREREGEEDGMNYDSKTVVDRDMLVTLKNKGNKTVHKVYFSFVAGADLLMLDFKVEFLGFEGRDRTLSGTFSTKDGLKSEAQVSMPLLRMNTQPAAHLLPFARSGMRPGERMRVGSLNRQEMRMLGRRQLQQGSTKPNLNIIAESQKKTTSNFNRTNKSSSLGMLKTKGKGSFREGEAVNRLEQARRNKELLQVYREKERELRETANKCKVMIGQFQKVVTRESIQRRKLNRSVVMLLYSAIFISTTTHLTNERVRRNQMSYTVNYLCNQFRKKMMQRKKQYCDLVPQFSKRMVVDEGAGITLVAKMVHRNCQTKAANIVSGVLLRLMPCFIVNCSFGKASDYRGLVRRIQKEWKSKHHNRIRGLLFFVDYHVEGMTKKHPNLALHTQQFYKEKVNRAICVEYVRDQGEKYRYIYQAYLRQLEDIQEVLQLNQTLIAQGKAASLLAVPERPTRPMHRFFRNLDILKSMVRTWFEIESKKHSKKYGKVVV